MRRATWIFSSLAAVCLVIGVIVWRTSGQPSERETYSDLSEPASKQAVALPIRQVVLFNSGVGYLQREGEVEGDVRIDLSFPAADVNDLLKSLILQDLSGGRISTVNYDSHDPIDKILRSFAVDLNNNPSLAQILFQARGEKIELLRQGIHRSGTIVGIETRKQTVKDSHSILEVEYLNLSTDNGLVSYPLEQLQSIRFLNPVLDGEFQRALRVLAGAHDANKKTVSLGFCGQGKRGVRVGYVIEHPIWKTSYRLRVEPNGKVFMQGWAIVENTSDDDWNDVRMVLVSGRPISYKMNMYEPLYIPRPEVEPELFASLRPQVYQGALQNGQQGINGMQWGVPGAMMGPTYGSARPYPPGPSLAGTTPGMPPGGYNQDYADGPMVGAPMAAAPLGASAPPPGAGYPSNGPPLAPAPTVPAQSQLAGGGSTVTNPGITNFSVGRTAQGNGDKLSYEELQRRREAQLAEKNRARREGTAIAGLNFKEGIASVASAEEVGDFYQYVLDQKITLPRQKSAMLPILDQTIEGTKVSIYNEATHAKYPLLGLKLKNSSNLHLSQGPITVYEDGSYAGDTRILDLQPNEERLLSYALDQAVEIKSDVKTSPSPDMTFKIGDQPSLTANYKMRKTRTYVIKNRTNKERTIIVEHPINSAPATVVAAPAYGYYGVSRYQPAVTSYPAAPVAADGTCWKLVEPKKPMETTRDHYRFQVVVPAGKTVKYEVVEEQERVDALAVYDGQPWYAVAAGLALRTQTTATPEKLLSLKIDKGLVLPTLKTRTSRTYFVQNNSDVDRSFTVDHLTRAGWVRLDDKQEPHKGPGAHRFVLPVAKGKTESREIVEERTWQETGVLVRSLPETTMRNYLASPVPSAEVKAVFTKYLAMNAKIVETQKQLERQQVQLQQLSDDQARLRENLKIIPQTSEPYKKFLEKFVAQEGEIETFQKQIRQLQSTLQQQQQEMDAAFESPSARGPGGPPMGPGGPPMMSPGVPPMMGPGGPPTGYNYDNQR